jgi:hypothetical protein
LLDLFTAMPTRVGRIGRELVYRCIDNRQISRDSYAARSGRSPGR